MPQLRWRHGRTADQARDLMQGKLRAAGYDDKVKWNGCDFSASVGFGSILNLKGRVSDQEVVLDTCSGAIGGTVQDQVRQILEKLFPGGEMEP